MNSYTVLLIILASVLAFAISVFQYRYKEKRSRWKNILAVLRFVSLLTVFLLLLNPKFNSTSNTIIKPNLFLLVDNSESIKPYQQELLKVYNDLSQDAKVDKRFTVKSFTYGADFKELDSISFTDETTDIASALQNIEQIYATEQTKIVLLGDGIQNIGEEYQYLQLGENFSLDAIAIGDTTQYDDLNVVSLFANDYSFVGNQFPLEANIAFTGKQPVKAVIRVTMNNKEVAKKNITLDKNNNTENFSTTLKATSAGIKNIAVSVSSSLNEKNLTNNSLETAVEVIDERTKVGIISDYKHPDLGTLKTSIESNKQREVLFLDKPYTDEKLADIDLFIFYQIGAGHNRVVEYAKSKNVGSFFIFGANTDWSGVNKLNLGFEKEDLGQKEAIFASNNQGFSLFDVSDFTPTNYPPLLGELGDILITDPHEILFFQKIRGVDLKDPLLAFFTGEHKVAVLFASDIWKWRMQTYRNENDFTSFDSFMGKIAFYLSSSQQKNRLQLNYDKVFPTPKQALISATFYDKTYRFDEKAQLEITVSRTTDGFSQKTPFVLKNSSYQVDLSNLEAGDYTFTVKEKKEGISTSGSFKISMFSLEAQVNTTDKTRLTQIANNNNGKVYYPNQLANLKEQLLEDDSFKPIQRSTKNVVPLIGFKWLLVILCIALAAEWFIRKYNGLL